MSKPSLWIIVSAEGVPMRRNGRNKSTICAYAKKHTAKAVLSHYEGGARVVEYRAAVPTVGEVLADLCQGQKNA
jgi:hypothetical protein